MATQKEQTEQEEIQAKLNDHVTQFPVNIKFPASVTTVEQQQQQQDGNKNESSKSLRTNPDLIQHRLLEAGVMFEDVQKLGQVTEAISEFVTDLESTGCFNSVQVTIAEQSETSTPPTTKQQQQGGGTENGQVIQVALDEKRWYSGYIGGGIKHEDLHTGGGVSSSNESLLPKLQFEVSGKLQNLSGNLDTTMMRYLIDQTSSTTISCVHERPLHTVLPEYSPLYDWLLTSVPHGSKASISGRAMIDHLDYEWTRSYKECQRLISLKIANVSNVPMPELAKGGYMGLEWALSFRDIMPRRHPTLPFAIDASSEIASQSGPSLKHSIKYEFHSNHTNDKFNPTSGIDVKGKVEVAGPPGDVGFLKMEGGISAHGGFSSNADSGNGNDTSSSNSNTNAGLTFHAALQTGVLRPITYGGLCERRSISDRFFTGGPMELRGFVPGGIGPRAKTGGATTPGGDSLGGDFFYTATLAASIPFPSISMLRDNGVRLFTFANAGTLTGLDALFQGTSSTADRKASLMSIARSTRTSIGGGLSVGTGFGRLEATYAVPLRYSPRDARRSVQVGLGFNFG